MDLLNFFGFQKIRNLFSIIKFYGGPIKTYLQIVRTDDIKIGKLVGVDKFGNKYYQNDNFFYGRNRWVVYADKFGYDYDASQVSPEWFGWLHYKTDLLPTEMINETHDTYPITQLLFPLASPVVQWDKSRPNYKWMAEPSENHTGTPLQYIPYSTTRPKIEPWVPPKAKK